MSNGVLHRRIYLDGDPDDLAALVGVEGVSWRIASIDHGHYLTSSDFAGIDDAGAVWQRAADLVGLISAGAAKMRHLSASMRRRHIAIVFSNGREYTTQFIEIPHLHSRSILFELGVVSSEGTIVRASFHEVLDALRDDPNVLDALRHLTRGDKWTYDYWKVYEVIRADVAAEIGTEWERALGPDGVNWVSDDEFARFEVAIHHEPPDRDDARHARKNPTRKLKTPLGPPMNESQAGAFIRALIERWARWKNSKQFRVSPPASESS